MIQEQMLLDRTEMALSEYKSELGANFPLFVNYQLAARLLKAEAEIEYLRRRIATQELIA